MARREVKSATGQKFVINQTVAGTYRGMREGQFGPDAPLVDIEVGGEVLTYFGKTVLANKLRAVPEGVEIEITFTGLKPGKKGKTYNDFDVFYDDGEPEEKPASQKASAPAPKSAAKAAPKPAPKKAAQPADDEVPF